MVKLTLNWSRTKCYCWYTCTIGFFATYSRGIPGNVDSSVSADEDPVKFQVLIFSEISQASLQSWDLQYSTSLPPCDPICPVRAVIPVPPQYWVEPQFVPSICVPKTTTLYCATLAGIRKKSLTLSYSLHPLNLLCGLTNRCIHHAGSREFSVFQGKWKQARLLNRSDLSVDCAQICLLACQCTLGQGTPLISPIQTHLFQEET